MSNRIYSRELVELAAELVEAGMPLRVAARLLGFSGANALLWHLRAAKVDTRRPSDEEWVERMPAALRAKLQRRTMRP